jgi:thiamine biosynthesis lipoprotein
VTTAADRARTVHVEHCMGTAFSIAIGDDGSWDGALASVVEWLHHVDAVFSTYKADSDICRIHRGELAVGDAAPEIAIVLDLCHQIEQETFGYFSAWYDGRLDPTGLVKGWAIEQSSRLLRSEGSHNHAVNGGGDIQTAGGPAEGEVWRIGISDPRDGSRVVAVVEGRDFAVATSGTAERGAHIVDPRTGRPATGLASVTVVGPELTRADCYATAAFAMGATALDWLESVPGHEGLVVLTDGHVASTSGLDV